MAFLDTDTYQPFINGERGEKTDKWKWDKVRPPTLIQKKMVALVLMAATRITLTSHLYTFDGKLYRQLDGGPIRDNITQIAARLVIYTFMKRYKE